MAERSLRKSKNILFVLFFFFMLFSLTKNISRIKSSTARIDQAREELEKLRIEEEELKYRLETVKSEEYVEKQLRDKLGLAKEGEVVVVLPDDEILRKLAPVYEKEEETLPDPNWKKWLNLFL